MNVLVCEAMNYNSRQRLRHHHHHHQDGCQQKRQHHHEQMIDQLNCGKSPLSTDIWPEARLKRVPEASILFIGVAYLYLQSPAITCNHL